VSEAPRTAVVCDSTSYLPRELVVANDLHVVSLYVTLGGEQRREVDITDYGQFYERLSASAEGATTSQPSVGDFTEVYGPLLERGVEIVSIHLASGISGTYEAALQARQSLVEDGSGGERIHVFDSTTGCGGLGMMCLVAAAASREGVPTEEIISRLGEARSELRMWFAIDTLEYLRKGGRIGAARAWLGSALQIKPILTLEEEITPVERVRTRRRVFERLVTLAGELEETANDGWVVQHIHDPETAQRLVAEGRQIFGTEPVFVSEVGPVIGAHTGPGLIGVGAIPRRLLG
jgi:DegV family protein with EDD domain